MKLDAQYTDLKPTTGDSDGVQNTGRSDVDLTIQSTSESKVADEMSSDAMNDTKSKGTKDTSGRNPYQSTYGQRPTINKDPTIDASAMIGDKRAVDPYAREREEDIYPAYRPKRSRVPFDITEMSYEEYCKR